MKKYIFTSSISAYNEYRSSIKESLFDPYHFTFDKKETMESNYGEAKRQAEVAFYKYAKFPVTAVRFPIVLDENDTTQRLQFHVNKVNNNKEIFFKNIEAEISFISAQDAAKALKALSESEYSAPINVASPSPISLRRFISYIEKSTGNNLILADAIEDGNESPYNIADSWYVDCSVLESLGIKLPKIGSYLPSMIEKIINE